MDIVYIHFFSENKTESCTDLEKRKFHENSARTFSRREPCLLGVVILEVFHCLIPL